MAKTRTDKAAKRTSEYIVEEYRLSEIVISSEVANPGALHYMSLASLFTNIIVIEDLFSNVVKLEVSLTDAEGFMETFPVIGDETIELTFLSRLTEVQAAFREEGTNHQKFKVYDIQMNPSESKYGEFTIFGVSEEYVRSMQKRVSKRYTGLNSDSIKDIVRKYLGYEKDLFLEKTKVTHSTIIPNWTPFEAINFLAARSISAVDEEIEVMDMQLQTSSGSFFVFYERLNEGFRFESIETLIAKQRGQDLPKYFYAPRATEGGVHLNEPGMFGVDSFQVINSFDSMRNLGRGMYASRLIAYDPIRMKYDIVKYDYFKDPAAQSDENSKTHDFVTMDGGQGGREYKLTSVHSSLLGDHTSMTKLATTTKDHDSLFVPPHIEAGSHNNINPATTAIGVNNTTFNDREAKSNHVEDWLLQRNAQEQEFDNIRLKLTIAGNSSRHVGDLIDFDFPSYKPTADFAGPHQLYGGIYMVTKINHIITQTRYNTEMEIVKNSMMTDLPGNDEGYDSEITTIQEGLDDMGDAGGKSGSRAMRNEDGSIRIVGGL